MVEEKQFKDGEYNQKEEKFNYYEKSIEFLKKYIQLTEQNPSESKWNEYAIKEKYLSSKSMGYISGIGFNKLCRKIRKEINNNKKIDLIE